jgi:hypothetical protein
MSRLSLALSDLMALRLEAAAQATGITTENRALAGVALTVAQVERERGLVIAAPPAPPSSPDLPPAPDEES